MPVLMGKAGTLAQRYAPFLVIVALQFFLVAVTPGANILGPSDQACSDGEDRGSKRPERGEVAPVRRLPDDPHQPGSAGNNRSDYHYRPQAARL